MKYEHKSKIVPKAVSIYVAGMYTSGQVRDILDRFLHSIEEMVIKHYEECGNRLPMVENIIKERKEMDKKIEEEEENA